MSAPGFTGSLKTRSWTAAELAAAGADRARFDLLENLSFVSAAHGTITAPAGMVTDLASIPRFAFAYISPDDPAIEYPSVVHDYIYNLGGVVPGIARPITREEADDVLIEAMRTCGARPDQCFLVRSAVRLGGAAHWGGK